MRVRPKPEQLFYDEMKKIIENTLINDPNFKKQGFHPSWYEKNNKIHYGLFVKKAEYILQRMEEMKHLILWEDE